VVNLVNAFCDRLTTERSYMYKGTISGEGGAEVVLSGGVSEADLDLDGASVQIRNNKGDLTIEIPAFDSHKGFVIIVQGDHCIKVNLLNPLP
jgi:hypothetical protein